jgi:PAS domain S-box-containing protein
LLGLKTSEIVGKQIQNFILSEDMDIYYLHQQKLIETGMQQTSELRMLAKDNEPFWAQIMATLSHDAAGNLMHRVVLTNIAERKLAKDFLRLSDSALKTITQGVLIFTPQRLIVSANAAFLAMTGYAEAELVGQDCSMLNGQQSGVLVLQRAFESIANGRVFEGEIFNYRKDGSGFWNEFSLSPVHDEQGQISHFISINTDISARKHLHDALQLKNLELQASTLVAEKANLAKSEFLSSMSHDLRSPLNAIVGFAQLLELGTPKPTPTQQRNIKRILAGGWYLLKLIDEILDLSTIESGKLAMPLRSLPLNQILQECQNLTEVEAENQGIEMHFPDATLPLWVVADSVRLKQVIVNLLSNAIKYNRPAGTVSVNVVADENGYLRISVKDTGEGISQAKMAQLFVPFERLGREHGTIEGTGIGLVMSKKLTELMGGTIGFKSCVGVGSEFWVEFKSAAAPIDTPTSSHLAPQSLALQDDQHSPSYTVLYVEDNPVNVDLVEQILACRDNLQLYSAPDGQQGLAVVQECHPDVILMDIHLPGMSGLEVLQSLRQNADTRHIPVIAISANAMPADVANGLSAGFFRYLTKPFQIDLFLATLDLALAQASLNRTLEPL